jgi:hypothetical protein
MPKKRRVLITTSVKSISGFVVDISSTTMRMTLGTLERILALILRSGKVTQFSKHER